MGDDINEGRKRPPTSPYQMYEVQVKLGEYEKRNFDAAVSTRQEPVQASENTNGPGLSQSNGLGHPTLSDAAQFSGIGRNSPNAVDYDPEAVNDHAVDMAKNNPDLIKELGPELRMALQNALRNEKRHENTNSNTYTPKLVVPH